MICFASALLRCLFLVLAVCQTGGGACRQGARILFAAVACQRALSVVSFPFVFCLRSRCIVEVTVSAVMEGACASCLSFVCFPLFSLITIIRLRLASPNTTHGACGKGLKSPTLKGHTYAVKGKRKRKKESKCREGGMADTDLLGKRKRPGKTGIESVFVLNELHKAAIWFPSLFSQSIDLPGQLLGSKNRSVFLQPSPRHAARGAVLHCIRMHANVLTTKTTQRKMTRLAGQRTHEVLSTLHPTTPVLICHFFLSLYAERINAEEDSACALQRGSQKGQRSGERTEKGWSPPDARIHKGPKTKATSPLRKELQRQHMEGAR